MQKEYKCTRTFLSHKHYDNSALVAVSLLLVCVLFSHFYWQGDYEFLAASFRSVFYEGHYWQLFSTLFVHANLGHLLSNSFMLCLMGFFVHRQYGPLVFPLSCIFVGALVNAYVLNTMPIETRLVGISGVVYLLWGFWLILYILIQRHVSLNRRFMKVVAISLMVLVPTSYDPQVSYLAHGVGLVGGILLGLLTFLIKKDYFRSFEKWEYINTGLLDDEDFEEEVELLLEEYDDENKTIH